MSVLLPLPAPCLPALSSEADRLPSLLLPAFLLAAVGDLRWAAPQNATAWSGVRNATEFGPQCAQDLQGTTAGIFSSGKTTSSEDCLTLNVWTPANATASSNLAVYFWIFGGRFEGGSGDVPTYDGSGLASKDVVVVTINYRLGAFGFLAHPDLSAESGHNSSGNYGVLDQQHALRWVHDNIAAFGGNPDQIVVGGQSAGSASALDISKPLRSQAPTFGSAGVDTSYHHTQCTRL